MKTLFSSRWAKSIKPFILIVIIISSFQSCVKDNFDFKKISSVQWNPNFAVPLVYSSLSINNIVGSSQFTPVKSLVKVNNDSSITMVYQTTLFSANASSLPGLTLPSPSQGPVTVPVPPGGGTYTQTIIVPFTTTNATKIDSITFKAGTWSFSFSGLPGNPQIRIDVPAAKKNGVAFSKLVTLPLNNNSVAYDLTDYDFDLTQVGSPAYNQINVIVTIITPASYIGGTLTASSSMTNLAFSKVFGELGQSNYSRYR